MTIFNVQCFQILMSALVTMVVVYKSVTTLLVATHVDATLDMSWREMDSHAMVLLLIDDHTSSHKLCNTFNRYR